MGKVKDAFILFVPNGLNFWDKIRKIHLGQRFLVKLLIRSLKHVLWLIPYQPRCIIISGHIGSRIWLCSSYQRRATRGKNHLLIKVFSHLAHVSLARLWWQLRLWLMQPATTYFGFPPRIAANSNVGLKYLCIIGTCLSLHVFVMILAHLCICDDWVRQKPVIHGLIHRWLRLLAVLLWILEHSIDQSINLIHSWLSATHWSHIYLLELYKIKIALDERKFLIKDINLWWHYLTSYRSDGHSSCTTI